MAESMWLATPVIATGYSGNLDYMNYLNAWLVDSTLREDLQFPHHENEIAQSEGAHQCQFVNYWMHNGFVRVDDEKMSKSLGNFFTIRDVLQKYDPEVVRFFILRAHYRSPLNYSDAHLDDARHALTRLYTALKNAPHTQDAAVDWNESHAQRFRAAMNDDFNTAEAPFDPRQSMLHLLQFPLLACELLRCTPFLVSSLCTPLSNSHHTPLHHVGNTHHYQCMKWRT
jgi:hypothetical protein